MDSANALFSSGKYSLALEAYAELERAGQASARLHSNKSACFAKLGQWESALQEASKAIAADPEWVRGYSRKGAALIGLGRGKEAIAAYEAGLGVDPSSQALKDGLALARRSGNRGTSDSTANNGSNAQTNPGFISKQAVGSGLLHMLASCLFCASIVSSVTGAAGPFYRYAFISSQIAIGLSLVASHGSPELGTLKTMWNVFRRQSAPPAAMQRVMMDPVLPQFIYAMVMSSTYPSILYTLPIAIPVTLAAAKFMKSSLIPRVRVLSPLEPMCSKLLNKESFLRQPVAHMELAVAGSLILELFTPRRSILATLMYVQSFLMLRYHLSVESKNSWRMLNAKMHSFVNHTGCPEILRNAYKAVEAKLSSAANPANMR